MRYLAGLPVAFALACSTAPVVRPADAPVDDLLTSAASDFHAHPPHPSQFRAVHLVRTPGGQYALCGEAFANAQWIPFATIKTSGYEQYLGGQSATFCGPWASDEDLSAALQSQFAAIK